MASYGTDCFITRLCLRPGIVGEERAGTTLARKKRFCRRRNYRRVNNGLEKHQEGRQRHDGEAKRAPQYREEGRRRRQHGERSPKGAGGGRGPFCRWH